MSAKFTIGDTIEVISQDMDEHLVLGNRYEVLGIYSVGVAIICPIYNERRQFRLNDVSIWSVDRFKLVHIIVNSPHPMKGIICRT